VSRFDWYLVAWWVALWVAGLAVIVAGYVIIKELMP
jgi:hypothetical protein